MYMLWSPSRQLASDTLGASSKAVGSAAQAPASRFDSYAVVDPQLKIQKLLTGHPIREAVDGTRAVGSSHHTHGESMMLDGRVVCSCVLSRLLN